MIEDLPILGGFDLNIEHACNTPQNFMKLVTMVSTVSHFAVANHHVHFKIILNNTKFFANLVPNIFLPDIDIIFSEKPHEKVEHFPIYATFH